MKGLNTRITTFTLIVLTEMYSRVCLLCIIVTLSLGYVASKPGVEENKKIFSVSLDVINPRDRNCKFMSNQSKCEVDLSGVKNSVTVANRDDGMFYVMTIQIGEAKQAFKVQIDTGSSLLWVFGSNCLDDESDYCKGHPKYVLEKDKEYEDFSIEYESGETSGKEVTDVVHVTDEIGIQDMLFGAAGEVGEEYEGHDGVMGLNIAIPGRYPSVISKMIEQDLITAPAFALYLNGGKSSEDGGEITFGGHNEDLVGSGSSVMTEILRYDIMVKMTSLKLGEELYCRPRARGCRLIIDSGSSEMSAPLAFVTKLHTEIKAGEHRIVDCDEIENFPTIEIMFGESLLTIESKYYIGVEEKEDEKVVERLCYSLFVKTDEDEYDWLFGVPIFVKYYIEFDYTKSNEHITFWTKK
ncbi:Lysosomal aspartic protease [Oopsacas minuta]|uniref:Lysosomal aspartic protease n=1 Tax=Oopsacas minuta TaxID=111878 RepID=A0AAV7JC28_9METZ|nr:Lysosomal aspartic protease [Oopsacas minuta]